MSVVESAMRECLHDRSLKDLATAATR
jgi:hypothetical protein